MEPQNKVMDVKKLFQLLENRPVIIDIGCRWGFQKHWQEMESVTQLMGLDADELEIDSLNLANKRDEFIPKVLGAKNGPGKLFITEDPACSSLYPPDEDLIVKRPLLAVTRLVSTKPVEISTFDDWIMTKGISEVDFIKLDIQGAELDVLRGAEKTLQSVRMLEVEVQFNPIYKGSALFGEVDLFLRQHGFSLWRIQNFTHYEMAGINSPTTTVEAAHYDTHTTKFTGKSGQLTWADAFFVRNEIAYAYPRPWETALKDACIANVLGFEDLCAHSLEAAHRTCPIDIAQKIAASYSPFSPEENRRIKMTISCSDSESIPKIPQAGEIFDGPDGPYQLMHNGIKITKDCYGGQWTTEIIRRLRGHHEPQEEKAFNEILKYIRPNATMLELGSFWSYYSLWFNKQIVNAQNYMIEPDPNNLAAGKRNFDLNSVKGSFLNAAIGKTSSDSIPFTCESDGQTRPMRIISVDDFVAREGITNIDLLLSDIQGFELEMLQGATRCIEQGLIRFLVISTHHHLFSNDPLTHQNCLYFLQAHGANILVEHKVSESFSGDGLIVASFGPEDQNLPKIEISRNDPANNLFRELEYDLHDPWQETRQIKSELAQTRIAYDLAMQQMNSLYTSRWYKLAAPFRMAANFMRSLKK